MSRDTPELLLLKNIEIFFLPCNKTAIWQVIKVKGVRNLPRYTSQIEYDGCDIDYLLEQIASGNTEALAHLYKITSASVYAYALSILKNPQDAEDVLHDCYVRIFTYTGTYHSVGKPMAWILTITRNLCMNKLQAQKREPRLYMQDWKQQIADKSHADQEEMLLVSACIDTLQEDERQIVILRCVASMSYKEIAQFLKLPLSTVLSKYHRTIKKLRKLLGEEV